jgi:aminoglycoside phosphotransferase (APT) family kinase protein
VRNPPITRPNPETRAWVGDIVGGRVVAARRLTGGTTSVVQSMTVEDARGRREHVVLRRYTQPDTEKTPSFIEQEARTLTQLTGTRILAPRLIAADPSGEHTGGVPALVMTQLPGRLDLAPRELERFIRQMAEQLARIHDTPIEGRPYDRAVQPDEYRIPTVSDRSIWLRGLEVMHMGQPAYESCFLHRDYQHFNMLWSRGRLTGIVDWPFASMGPREIDSGHCRLNLAVLFAPEWAERFRLAYEAETGRTTDPWWDIHAIWSFHDVWQEFIPRQVAGRRPVDLDGMPGRVDELLAATLKRL